MPYHDLRESRRLSSKMGIDATRKHTYPATSLPPDDDLARARTRWAEYGFAALMDATQTAATGRAR